VFSETLQSGFALTPSARSSRQFERLAPPDWPNDSPFPSLQTDACGIHARELCVGMSRQPTGLDFPRAETESGPSKIFACRDFYCTKVQYQRCQVSETIGLKRETG
jgi:hypothetical protein